MHTTYLCLYAKILCLVVTLVTDKIANCFIIGEYPLCCTVAKAIIMIMTITLCYNKRLVGCKTVNTPKQLGKS